jgi:uncharacterized protein
MKFAAKISIFSLVVFMASCVSLTLNIYFPATEIKEAAEEIEQRVRTGQGAEGLESTSFEADIVPRRFYVSISFDGREAYAAEKLNIDIKTPLIIKILKSRTVRYKKNIAPLMDKGVLGEGANGYLAIRDKKGLDLKASVALKKVIDSENKDRKSLYEEILRANTLEFTKVNMGKVEKLFAEVIQKKLKAGQYYEVKDGKKSTWIKKQKKKE